MLPCAKTNRKKDVVWRRGALLEMPKVPISFFRKERSESVTSLVSMVFFHPPPISAESHMRVFPSVLFLLPLCVLCVADPSPPTGSFGLFSLRVFPLVPPCYYCACLSKCKKVSEKSRLLLLRFYFFPFLRTAVCVCVWICVARPAKGVAHSKARKTLKGKKEICEEVESINFFFFYKLALPYNIAHSMLAACERARLRHLDLSSPHRLFLYLFIISIFETCIERIYMKETRYL
ncbi:hypothetical protein ABB37_07304 [Leptomonas pyrrhocoris]|uniref:Uncharacterized protein n=1 Tax=Leptomonas pyrrhocoris TaxID=157538 RepID=A0A0N0VE40_LEPPY|nr:hypothetical protein ABB37_07304 [Leptomonas pyrrhocoris]KPA76924.1 hypothetical protein ABB37_07304 [Leptomonas pyrrhocoris]|eukprot:XP_015655363.1 hypothetical protein ABB37_07304 [Leptomonas pyrrhocoris]